MIGLLKGILEVRNEDHLIINVGGVGYVVHASMRTLELLPSLGEAVKLIIETHVREDMIRLYGFTTHSERDWFRLLQNVQGVGSKVALAILSALPPDVLTTAIITGDKTMVSRAPGVGPKLAARIVVELKDKAPAGDIAIGIAHFGKDNGANSLSGGANSALPEALSDAISALVNLGYGAPQARTAVLKASAEVGDEYTTATLIRLGLKALAS